MLHHPANSSRGHPPIFWQRSTRDLIVLPMISIIYVSDEAFDFDKQQLIELSVASRVKNRRLWITGFISRYNGNFIQYLEGKESDVMDLLADITGFTHRDDHNPPVRQLGYADAK